MSTGLAGMLSCACSAAVCTHKNHPGSTGFGVVGARGVGRGTRSLLSVSGSGVSWGDKNPFPPSECPVLHLTGKEIVQPRGLVHMEQKYQNREKSKSQLFDKFSLKKKLKKKKSVCVFRHAFVGKYCVLNMESWLTVLYRK